MNLFNLLALFLIITYVSTSPIGYSDDEEKDISDINREILDFAGDQFIETDIKSIPGPFKSWGYSSSINLWPNGTVPYVILAHYLSNERNTIEEAMTLIRDKVGCVQFIPRTTETAYIEIGKRGGCWSYVGKVSPSYQPQQISLSDGCVYKTTIVHELMHALGFWHEQSRSDRDQYVTINWDNIRQGKAHNFNKRTYKTESFNTPYDFVSVMHYRPNSFSINGQPTIVAKNPANIIQRDPNHISQGDIQGIKTRYGCNFGCNVA